MSDKYILEAREPVPCDLLTWARWFETGENRHVAKDNVGEVLVSTVFLGIDHGFGSDGPPILFETIVFGGPLDQEQERYATWTQAEAGHAEMLRRVRETNQ
jgi:hypothetical protein